ncbi:MAG: hypothetical protein AAGM22_23070 [Acidobacteriota bacterium]
MAFEAPATAPKRTSASTKVADRRESVEARSPADTELLGPGGKTPRPSHRLAAIAFDRPPTVGGEPGGLPAFRPRQVSLGRLLPRQSPTQAPARPAVTGPTSTAPLQLKKLFAHEPRSGTAAETYGYARLALADDIKRSVAGLGEDATTDEAWDAVRQTFHGNRLKPEGHGLERDGTSIYLTNPDGHRIDKLGALSHDQDAQLYRAVAADAGDKNSLFINRSDGLEYVKDANGLFTPRFQTRSITKKHGAGADRDLERLNKRQALVGEAPESDASPLEHVGGKDTAYISFTKGAEDVTNAQGAKFNQSKTGRITADLLQVDRANIVDVSSKDGAEAELRPRLGAAARDDWKNLWEKAGEQEAAVRGADYSAASHAAATAAKPSGDLTGQQWQGLLDARRTKEVLVHGELPFEAVTAFGEANADLSSGQARDDIAAHQARSARRSDAAQQTLDTYENTDRGAHHATVAAEVAASRAALTAASTVSARRNRRNGADRLAALGYAHDALYDAARLHQNPLDTGIHANAAAAAAALRVERHRILGEMSGVLRAR